MHKLFFSSSFFLYIYTLKFINEESHPPPPPPPFFFFLFIWYFLCKIEMFVIVDAFYILNVKEYCLFQIVPLMSFILVVSIILFMCNGALHFLLFRKFILHYLYNLQM